MRALVKSDFTDIKAGIVRSSGDEFECTKERFDEISAALPGFIEEVKPKRTRKKKED